MPVKPKETIYDGWRFRSRLEARWGVFYNALQIPYEYELEGYPVGELGSYLPDFWLPEQGVWVEIKPKRPSERERRKAHALAVSSGCRVYVFIGGEFSPSALHSRLGFVGSLAEAFPGSETPIEGESGAMWVDCPICGPSRAPSLSGPHHDEESIWCERCGGRLHHDTPRLLAAYQAARSARFEFGESGPPR